MTMDFDEFLDILISKLSDIAKDAAEDIKESLIKDGTAFAEKTRERLLRWAALVAADKLTIDEFKYLLEAQKDLAAMEALKQKGLAKIRIDKLRNSLIDAVVESVVAVL